MDYFYIFGVWLDSSQRISLLRVCFPMPVSYGSESACEETQKEEKKVIKLFSQSNESCLMLLDPNMEESYHWQSRAILPSQLLIFTLNEMVSTIKQILQINYFYFLGKTKSELKCFLSFHSFCCVFYREGQVDDGAQFESNVTDDLLSSQITIISIYLFRSRLMMLITRHWLLLVL